MNSQAVKKKISKLPNSPGVYQFWRGKKILYVGKATSLRDRVRSYMSSRVLDTRGPLITKMLSEFTKIDYIKTNSVLEALILEAKLIKKYQPEANTLNKDDKSFNYVVITKEDFPRVLVIRGKELHEWGASKGTFDTPIKYSFGPFTNGGQLKEAMKIVRRIFPYRDKCLPFSEQKLTKKSLVPRSFSGVGCFNRQIGLCPGVCTGEISKSEYVKIIKNITLFFEGDKKQIKKNLEKQMKEFAKMREFEKAQKIKKTVFALNHIQDVALIKENQENKGDKKFRIESYDVAHMSGENVVGVMTVVENGEVKKSDYRKFKVKNAQDNRGQAGNNDTKALAEILTRRLGHIEWPIPDLMVVDGAKPQKNVMEKILKENSLRIPVVSVVKDEYHKPKEILGDKKYLIYEREILLANSESHRFAINYHKKLRDKIA